MRAAVEFSVLLQHPFRNSMERLVRLADEVDDVESKPFARQLGLRASLILQTSHSSFEREIVNVATGGSTCGHVILRQVEGKGLVKANPWSEASITKKYSSKSYNRWRSESGTAWREKILIA